MTTLSVIYFNEKAEQYYETRLQVNNSFQLLKGYAGWHISVPSYSWGNEMGYKGVLIFLNKRKIGSWKKVCRDSYQYACVWKGTWLFFAWLVFILYLTICSFPSWLPTTGAKKSASFPFPTHHFFLVLITGGFFFCLFVCFPLTLQSLPKGAGWDVVMTRAIWEIPPESGWHFFNTHSGLKWFSGCRQKGICGTKLCRPAKYGLLLESHMNVS